MAQRPSHNVPLSKCTTRRSENYIERPSDPKCVTSGAHWSACMEEKQRQTEGAPKFQDFLKVFLVGSVVAQADEGAQMPLEVVVKILSYLDAGSLFCLGFVNKRFDQLTNSNTMWHRFYTCQRAKRKRSRLINELTDGVDLASVQEKPEGFWRRRFFKELTSCNGNWQKKLQTVHSYTGLPSRTAEVLRSCVTQWEITMKDVRGHENRIKHSHIYFGEASLTVSWSSVDWSSQDIPVTFELHAVTLVPLSCPVSYRPGWRSLLTTVVIKKDDGNQFGSDKLVRLLYLDNEVTLGVWQEQKEIAFVMVNLHHHRLVERSLLGSSKSVYEKVESKARFDDVDPEYGLHGYTVHIELHNTVQNITSGRFAQLFCRRDQIADGYLQLRVIRKENGTQHLPVCGNISLPWRTEALQGRIQRCCILTLTVLDEAHTPFWCISAPVALKKTKPAAVQYDCMGDSFGVQYQDSGGKLELEIEKMEVQKQYIMVQLIVYLPINKVNRHFGRDY